MKLWYAVQMNEDDNDWGCGSFDKDEAIMMAMQIGEDSQIAVIDGCYDENGNHHSDPICIKVLKNGEDF